ncbi:MAG TPA: bifunctional DNA-formamidopyrimidine glycosylase/DNA-(apurinic or apyrimidinic site) lyase [Gemmatimonadaceae bacterium]
MPELPETETLARDLDRLLPGRRIAEVRVLRSDVLRGIGPKQLGTRLAGAEIVRVWRRAKMVVIDVRPVPDARTTRRGDHWGNGPAPTSQPAIERLVVQPRFTGGLVVDLAGLPATDAYAAIEFRLEDGGRFTYRDVRRLGTVALLDAAQFAKLDRRLGVEPLDSSFTTTRLSDFLRSSDRAVKKILMDQRLVAGVGNIYANEALWLARVDPSRPGRRVAQALIPGLRDAVVRVLTEAIEARGTTFRDFRDAHGERGGYAARLAVYGRAGAACRRCATRLAETHAIDGRATVFCFRCQS